MNFYTLTPIFSIPNTLENWPMKYRIQQKKKLKSKPKQILSLLYFIPNKFNKYTQQQLQQQLHLHSISTMKNIIQHAIPICLPAILPQI